MARLSTHIEEIEWFVESIFCKHDYQYIGTSTTRLEVTPPDLSKFNYEILKCSKCHKWTKSFTRIHTLNDKKIIG